jgi:hypothetical protein
MLTSTTTTKHTPKVLFIRNVFLHDCIDISSSLESKLLDSNNTDSISNILCSSSNLINNNLMELTTNIDYQKMPNIFESLETWPKNTNLHCWYCTNQFNYMPKTIPLVIEPNVHTKNGDKYLIGVEAICCRWPCCVSYITETTKDISKYIEKINNLYFFIKLITGNYPQYIPSAPSKYLLKKFGGELTTEYYYKLYDKLEKQEI